MATRKEQKEKRRQDILEAGLSLFIRKGYESIKISDVAQKAGMSVGLLYHYFESIEALHEELLELGLSARTGQYFPPYSNCLDYFLKAATHIFDMAKENHYTAELFVLMNQTQHNSALPKSIKDRLEQNDIIEKSLNLVVEGQQQKMIRQGNPMALVLSFWLAVQAYIETIALYPNTPYPQPEWFVDLLKAEN